MRGTTCHAAAASKDAAVVYARRHAPSVSCPLGSIQSLHGITCHAADAQKGAASELSATLRAERPAILRAAANDCTASRAVLQPLSRASATGEPSAGRALSTCGPSSSTAWRHTPCRMFIARRVTCRVYVIISWAVANRCVSARAVLRLCSRVKTFELSAASRAKRTPTSRVW